MRLRTRIVLLGAMFALTSQVGTVAPIPASRKGTSEEACTLLALPYPKLGKAINDFPKRAVFQFKTSSTEDGSWTRFAFAAKEVVFSDDDKITLKGAWTAFYVWGARQGKDVLYMHTSEALPKVELQFDRPVKQLSDCEKARICVLKYCGGTYGTPPRPIPGKEKKK
jgi:hypothetical protein